MDTLRQDVRYALRALRLHVGFTAVVVLTLALGIGANTAIFSVIDAAMLRPLPFREPERLMQLYLTIPRAEAAAVDSFVWSYPKFQTLRATQHAFDRVAAYSGGSVSLTGTDSPERLLAEFVSAPYFDLLGVGLHRGRGFLADEDSSRGTHPVTVLSHALWQRRFNGDEAIIGRTIEISKRRLTVVGVARPGFDGLTGSAELWIPMAMTPVFLNPAALDEQGNHWLDVVGRLASGMTPEAGRSEMLRVGPIIDQANGFGPQGGKPWSATAESLRDARSDAFLRRAMIVLLGAVGFVLLIACVNVANLLLARGAGRQRELAVKAALGARRTRLARQLLTESLALAIVGGALGLALAVWFVDLLRAIAPAAMQGASAQAAQFLELDNAGVNPRVLFFTGMLSVITGLVFGVIPALVATRPDLNGVLRQGSPGASRSGLGSLRKLELRSVLIAAEVALAMILLAGAGLMLRSFERASAIDPGFDPTNTISFRLAPPADSIYTAANAPVFKARLLDRLEAIPGVVGATAASCAPLSSACGLSVVIGIDGTTVERQGNSMDIGVHSVSPDYFRVLGVPLVRGRSLTEQDRAGSPRVVVLNNTAARRFFPGVDPIGRRIAVGTGFFAGGREYAEIVGIAGDVRYDAIDEAPRPQVYYSALQNTSPRGLFAVRTRSDPASVIPAIREAVRAEDPDLPVYSIETMDERLGSALSRMRFGAVLLGAFGAAALLLAGMGVYGVMAYSVAQRTREVGIRMALGARSSDVMGMMLRQGLAIVLLGVVVGIIGAVLLSQVLAGLLYDVEPVDPVSFSIMAAVLVASAAIACYLPARRATRVEPSTALRTE
jgi:putative ABC transport system permease protein